MKSESELLSKQKKTAEEIYDALKDDPKMKEKGHIVITLAGLEVKVKGADSVGNLIQEWFGKWLVEHGIYARPNPKSQEFPDFFLSEKHECYLEVKSFKAGASPAFDIANFYSLQNSLISNPDILDADYLVFEYSFTDGKISIKNIYLKKLWQLTSSTLKTKDKKSYYPLKVQVKEKKIYNIRPYNFAKKCSYPSFSSMEDFISAFAETVSIDAAKYQDQYKIEGKPWLKLFLEAYKKRFGKDLTIEDWYYPPEGKDALYKKYQPQKFES